jgi:hypothetical protein
MANGIGSFNVQWLRLMAQPKREFLKRGCVGTAFQQRSYQIVWPSINIAFTIERYREIY